MSAKTKIHGYDIARYRLHYYFAVRNTIGWENVLYCDTDSVYCKSKTNNEKQELVNNEERKTT